MSEKDFGQRSLRLHRELGGKWTSGSKFELETQDDLSLAYTPGVAEVSRVIAEDPSQSFALTMRKNTVAVVSDGTAVLGLGDVGPEAALPVMEGKAALLRALAGIDAVPIVVDTKDPTDLIRTVRRIAPTFGGVNLEDISAPNCFVVERALQDLGIPVFHDDQHGTAIVLLAALLNACRITGREPESLKVVINGAGAAGTAIAKLLRCVGQDPNVCVPVRDVLACDSKGILCRRRWDELNDEKRALLGFTNLDDRCGSLMDALQGADVFIGVSVGGLLGADHIRAMAERPIVFALANPEPEIMPDVAMEAGAAVVGTGRSDLMNQVNNVLAFPGIFRGALDARAQRITESMKIGAAHAIAAHVKEPHAQRLLPDPLDRSVAQTVAQAVAARSE